MIVFLALFLAVMPSFATPKNGVFVSILPQKFFVEQLAGDFLDVNVMVRPGMSPATYEPLPQQMGKLVRSRAFFNIGVPFEKTLLKKMKDICPQVEIIPTDVGVAKRVMKSFDALSHDHSHDSQCSHSTGTADPHIWLDPELVKLQAQNITAGLKRLFPEKKDDFTARLASFTAKLDEISTELSGILAPFKGKTMLVFHPAFGYFADRFGLIQQAIEIEGKDPAPRQMVDVIRKCKADKVRIIFVQKQFSSKSAQAIARAIGGIVIPIDPLAENYFVSMKQLATAVAEGLGNE